MPKCAIVTSCRPAPADIKGEETGEGLTEKLRQYDIYRKMLAAHFNEPEDAAMYKVEHDAPPAVRLRNNRTLELHVRPLAGRDVREAVLHRWYRHRLRDRLPALLAKWEPEIGVSVGDLRIRKMKTRWGSCNAEARRIWLNLDLAKKPASCLEYILEHEMVHCLERDHNDRFRELMDRFMPQWRLHRDELNRAPLAHEDWRYRPGQGGAPRGSLGLLSLASALLSFPT